MRMVQRPGVETVMTDHTIMARGTGVEVALAVTMATEDRTHMAQRLGVETVMTDHTIMARGTGVEVALAVTVATEDRTHMAQRLGVEEASAKTVRAETVQAVDRTRSRAERPGVDGGDSGRNSGA